MYYYWYLKLYKNLNIKNFTFSLKFYPLHFEKTENHFQKSSYSQPMDWQTIRRFADISSRSRKSLINLVLHNL